MPKPKRPFQDRYEELMRNAGEARARVLLRNLELERLHKLRRLNRRDLSSVTAQRSSLAALTVLDEELIRLRAQLAEVSDAEERVLIKAEIVHFEAVIKSLISQRSPRRGYNGAGDGLREPVPESEARRIIAALDGPHRGILLAILHATRTGRRKPPEAGLAVPAEPPSGPRPRSGGAAAPLDFDA